MTATNDVSGAVEEIYQTLHGVAGLRPTPSSMPTNAACPFPVVYQQNDRYLHEPQGVMTGLHNIVIEIHLSTAQDVSRAVEEVAKFADPVANAIFADHMNRIYSTILTMGEISAEFVYSDWNGVDTLALRFVVQNVKVQANIT